MRVFPFLTAAVFSVTALTALRISPAGAETKPAAAAAAPTPAAVPGSAKAVKAGAEAVSAVVDFASGEGAVKAITDDSADPYFSKLKPLEVTLKTGSPLQAGEEAELEKTARARYGKLTLEFTDSEKDLLQKQTALVDAGCAAWPLFRDTPWRFVKVSDKLEGGLPHTRGAWIVMPENVLAGLASEHARARIAIQQLLIHEKIHVHQRLHPGFYDGLYTKVWSWKKVAGLKLPEDILDREIHNPDGVRAEWALVPADGAKGRLLLPILQVEKGGEELPMAQALSMEVITLKAGGAGTGAKGKAANPSTAAAALQPETDSSGGVSPRPLAEVEDFQKAFPASRSNYHPNEVAADVFSSIVLMESLLPAELRESAQLKAAAALLARERAWFKENFGQGKAPASR